MKSLLGAVYSNWQRFWFESFDPGRWKIFRLASCLTLFGFYAVRHADLLEFYSSRHGFPLEALGDFNVMAGRLNVVNGIGSDLGLLAAHGAYLLALLCMAFGFVPRQAAAVGWLLHVSWIHTNMAATYGVDTIFTFFLLSLLLVGAGSRERNWKGALSSVGMRLVQIQVCVIYGFSGLGKLKGTTWWTGEALWGVLANAQLARFDFGWISHFPVLISILTSATLLWEIYFPALIWIPRLRPWVLLFGLGLHLSIGVTMNLPFFAAVMISSYALFLSQRERDWVLMQFGRAEVAMMRPVMALRKKSARVG